MEKTLLESVEQTLGKLSEKARFILRARLGADGDELTLEETAKRLGVTRQRIQQLEDKHIEQISLTSAWPTEITEKLTFLLNKRSEPLYLDVLELEDVWFSGFSGNYPYLINVIETFTSKYFRAIWINDRRVVTRINEEKWITIVKNIKLWLEQSLTRRLTESDIDLLIESIVTAEGAAELRELVWDEVSTSLHFAANDKEERILVACGRSIEDITSAVLEESRWPLHYKEITRKVRERAGSKVGPHRVLNSLRRIGALLYGRGTYGLPKHMAVSDSECSDVLLQVERIVSEGSPDRQWHCVEILDSIRTKVRLSPAINQYVLNIIISRSSVLHYLGRFVWALERSEQGSEVDRIDMAQAFASLLEHAGRPLTTRELKARLSKQRGIHSMLQIHPSERMIALAPNYWGLVDRDVALKEHERTAILETLYRTLLGRDRPVRETEILKVLSSAGHILPLSVDGYVVLGLAQRDVRFRVQRGRTLKLSSSADEVT